MNKLTKTGIGSTLATLTLAVTTLSTQSAQAFTIFTDRAAWEAAVAGRGKTSERDMRGNLDNFAAFSV